MKGRFSQAFRWATKLAILLKTSTFKKIKNKIHKEQTKQSRAILLTILAYVQTGLKDRIQLLKQNVVATFFRYHLTESLRER